MHGNQRLPVLIVVVLVAGGLLPAGGCRSLTPAEAGRPTRAAGSWGRHRRFGVNVGLWLTEHDLHQARTYGFDHVRVQLLPKNMPVTEQNGNLTFTPDAWNRLDAFLVRARKAGLGVVVDLHQRPTFRVNEWDKRALSIWRSDSERRRFASLWAAIARRYAGDRESIIGYDLLNEPNPPYTPEGDAAWNEIVRSTVQAIRRYDSWHTIIVECTHYANPEGMRNLSPVPDDTNVIYSFHMYAPHEFTEQGTRPQWPFGQTYPGVIPLGWDNKQPVRVDRKWLEQALAPVVSFQQRYHARVWVGEFSARRDAPANSAWRYLRDVLDLFEQHGWSWAYHAFRESRIWDAEIPAEATPPFRRGMTPRLRLLQEYIERGRARTLHRRPVIEKE